MRVPAGKDWVLRIMYAGADMDYILGLVGDYLQYIW